MKVYFQLLAGMSLLFPGPVYADSVYGNNPPACTSKFKGEVEVTCTTTAGRSIKIKYSGNYTPNNESCASGQPPYVNFFKSNSRSDFFDSVLTLADGSSIRSSNSVTAFAPGASCDYYVNYCEGGEAIVDNQIVCKGKKYLKVVSLGCGTSEATVATDINGGTLGPVGTRALCDFKAIGPLL